jgi:hypothetical protein
MIDEHAVEALNAVKLARRRAIDAVSCCLLMRAAGHVSGTNVPLFVGLGTTVTLRRDKSPSTAAAWDVSVDW